MSGSVVGTSDLPPELKGAPSCSEPDPDSLNLSSPPMNAPDLAPSTPPAQRVRAWAQSCHRVQELPRSPMGRSRAAVRQSRRQAAVHSIAEESAHPRHRGFAPTPDDDPVSLK